MNQPVPLLLGVPQLGSSGQSPSCTLTKPMGLDQSSTKGGSLSKPKGLVLASMFDGDRMRELMASRDISQSALARMVGVSQTTIAKLVLGKGYGSKYLHRIARELGTSPAYLSGETDDPQADAPAAPEFSFDERRLVECFGALAPPQRSALLTVALAMAERCGKERAHA